MTRSQRRNGITERWVVGKVDLSDKLFTKRPGDVSS